MLIIFQVQGKAVFYTVIIVILKGVKIPYQVSTAFELKWNHPRERLREPLHTAVGKTVFLPTMAKPFSYQKYSGAFDLRKGRKIFGFLLKDSCRHLHDQIHHSCKTLVGVYHMSQRRNLHRSIQ